MHDLTTFQRLDLLKCSHWSLGWLNYTITSELTPFPRKRGQGQGHLVVGAEGGTEGIIWLV